MSSVVNSFTKSFAALLITSLLLSCVGGIQEEELLAGYHLKSHEDVSSEYQEVVNLDLNSSFPQKANILIHKKVGLSLPHDWFFLPPPSGSEVFAAPSEKILYRFSSPQHNVSGICARVKTEVPLNLEENPKEKIEKLYSASLPETYKVFRVLETRVDYPAFLVHGSLKEGKELFISLLLPDGQSLYIAEVSGGSTTMRKRSKLLSHILHNFGLFEPSPSYRLLGKEGNESGLSFQSFDSPWHWYADVDNGFTLYSADRSVDTFVRVSKINTRQVPEPSFPVGEQHHTTLTYEINNIEREVKVLMERSVDSERSEMVDRGVFSFTTGEEVYRVDIRAIGLPTTKNIEKYLSSDIIRGLFEENLRF